MKTLTINNNTLTTEIMSAIEAATPFDIRDNHSSYGDMAKCIGVWVQANGRLSFAAKYKIYCLNEVNISKRDNEVYLSTMSNGGLINQGEYYGNGMNNIAGLIICDNTDELKQVINDASAKRLAAIKANKVA